MPMESPNPDRVDAWLAGHADGELDPATRQRVEEWLATDPQAAEIFRDQELLSPGNAEFWSAVEPPTVSDAKWDAVCDAISRRCPAPVPRPIESRGWMKVAIGVAIAASIAAVAIYALKPADEPNREFARPVKQEPLELAPTPRSPATDDPLAGYATIPVARPGDVFIVSVRGGVSPFVVGPSQPVPEELTLASALDVEVESIRPATATGTLPNAKMTAETGGVPMIYAALPR